MYCIGLCPLGFRRTLFRSTLFRQLRGASAKKSSKNCRLLCEKWTSFSALYSLQQWEYRQWFCSISVTMGTTYLLTWYFILDVDELSSRSFHAPMYLTSICRVCSWLNSLTVLQSRAVATSSNYYRLGHQKCFPGSFWHILGRKRS